MISQQEVRHVQDSLYTSEELAQSLVDHITNDKGEILARVWENPGFQEIYDYKGMEKQRRRLKRKQEQVFNTTDAGLKLFQKVYYHPALLQQDEITLRQIFVKCNDAHETTNKFFRGAFFLGYWPLTYLISRRTKPTGVLLFTLGYYGIYKFGAQRFALNSFQGSLNRHAEDLAKKYGVVKPDDYVSQ